ncbi:MAG: sodium-dependent transporter [Prevotella sp.]|nr:sodium-dependent transporter [Prevotella sp.]
MTNSERPNFGSTIGVILATAGSAVGLGNVWRFPYMTGQNGGAAFVLIYIGCVLLLGIPCMLSEFIIGRRAQANTARAYSKLANGTPWRLIGYFGVITGFLITSYYVVVSGWCLQYIYASAVGSLQGDPDYIKTYFDTFSTHPWKPALWMLVFILICHFIISRGVEKGIERGSKLMMPLLFILLIVIAVASCLMPGASGGIRFLFSPDFSKVNGDVFLGALGQAFYSLSLGMGCLCTYASYFKRDTHLTKSAVQIISIDTLIAILAGLMIFPAFFATYREQATELLASTDPAAVRQYCGPGLVFITLPNVFQQAFSGVPLLGQLVALMFYALLSLAALTSLMSLHEVSTAFFHEELNISRKRGAALVTVLCAFIGLFCALSYGDTRSWLIVGGKSLFDWFDFLTGQIFLPMGGLLTSLFLGWYVPKHIIRDELTNGGTLRGRIFTLYLFCVRFVCPLAIMLVFLNGLKII